MKLTENFSLEEFSCKDGTEVPSQYMDNLIELAENLEVIRDVVRSPIRINSSYRHPSYNANVGGSSRSQHLTASAADITIDGMTPDEVYSLINQMAIDGHIKNGGLGRYHTFTHYDIRNNPVRWDNR